MLTTTLAVVLLLGAPAALATPPGINPVVVTGVPSTFDHCARLREEGNRGCIHNFPAAETDNDPMTSPACIAASGRYADKCIQSVNQNKPFNYNFNYPPSATPPTTPPTPPPTTPPTPPGSPDGPLVSGTAKSYTDCTDFQHRGNKACEAFPEWSPDPSTPVRYMCMNANVE
ncbi:hypothetical protein HDU67_001285 [Dinochytrium kinnereticum]|nr:hypothetical protein HDU67_001285 [Dinochytrium kinnereticum]